MWKPRVLMILVLGPLGNKLNMKQNPSSPLYCRSLGCQLCKHHIGTKEQSVTYLLVTGLMQKTVFNQPRLLRNGLGIAFQRFIHGEPRSSMQAALAIVLLLQLQSAQNHGPISQNGDKRQYRVHYVGLYQMKSNHKAEPSTIPIPTP